MNVVSAIVVVVLCGWVGRTLRVPLTATDEPSRPFRLLLYALTGAGLLLLWLLALDFFGVRWNGVSAIAIPALIAAAISAAVVRRFDARRLGTQRFETQHAAQPRLDRRVLPLGWGDALALYTIVVLVLLLGEPCLTMSDFLFHWGFKAQRFWLDGGIDIGFGTHGDDGDGFLGRRVDHLGGARGRWLHPCTIDVELLGVLHGRLSLGALANDSTPIWGSKASVWATRGASSGVPVAFEIRFIIWNALMMPAVSIIAA